MFIHCGYIAVSDEVVFVDVQGSDFGWTERRGLEQMLKYHRDVWPSRHTVLIDIPVTEIPVAILVIVALARIGGNGAIVEPVPNPVRVQIASVTDPIAVPIGLIVGHDRAIVGVVVDPISVDIGVAEVSESIEVEVFLTRIRVRRAVVASVADAVAIAIPVRGVGVVRAEVADIANAISIPEIGLTAVPDFWAIIGRVVETIMVDVVVNAERRRRECRA